MRSPLTEAVQRVQSMIAYVRENLDDQEYDLFLDLINPEPEQKVGEKPKSRKPKKILHCDACDYTKRHQVHKDTSRSDYHVFEKPTSQLKSKRAKGIAAALNENLQQGKEAKVDSNDNGDDDEDRCLVLRRDLGGTVCGMLSDHNVHHMQSARGYHEFDPGKSHALAAGEGL